MAFIIESLNRIASLAVAHPNEGSPWIYIVRLFAFLLILVAILRKNYGTQAPSPVLRSIRQGREEIHGSVSAVGIAW